MGQIEEARRNGPNRFVGRKMREEPAGWSFVFSGINQNLTSGCLARVHLRPFRYTNLRAIGSAMSDSTAVSANRHPSRTLPTNASLAISSVFSQTVRLVSLIFPLALFWLGRFRGERLALVSVPVAGSRRRVALDSTAPALFDRVRYAHFPLLFPLRPHLLGV